MMDEREGWVFCFFFFLFFGGRFFCPISLPALEQSNLEKGFGVVAVAASDPSLGRRDGGGG